MSEFVIAVSAGGTFKSFVQKTPSIVTVYEYPNAKIFVIRTSLQFLLQNILPRDEVQFIDILRVPKEEVAVSNLDLSANKVNLVHRHYLQYNGNGFGVSVKENRPDTADIDFKGRYVISPFVSPVLSSHATIMSTVIAGAGNSYYEGRGVANGAIISSVNFSNLLPEPDTYYQQFNIHVQNHSYGTAIENYYGPDASAYDASVATRPVLLHVFSAGNSGLLPGTGNYTGLPSFANITGSFKMAKNIITVGHTDSFGVVSALSSRGPAYDGRIKPELVAFGEDGSSGAAAIVAGTALVAQDAYKDLHGNFAGSDLVKAVLLNSADDAGNKGPDYISGYGSLNAIKAIDGIRDGHFFTGSIANAATNVHTLVIPPGIKLFKITLVWTDPPATANALKALINDVDVELSFPATGESWQPWVLSHFPHIDSLSKLPVRKRDDLNNAEQITIDNPVAGNYLISVKGFNIRLSQPQTYSIAYQFDTADTFHWYYPVQTDNILGGRVNTIRWKSTLNNPTGQLDYSIDGGNSWQLINNNIDLGNGYYKWNAPDTFVTALLRMRIGITTSPTEKFTVSKRFNVYVGFNCTDSFLFYWNKVKGVNSYQVYKLGSRYMEPFLITSDTAVILSKAASPSLYYAVAPILDNLKGVRSYAYNYTTQGVGCYIRAFLVSVAGNRGFLELQLGSTYLIRSITWEKFVSGSFKGLDTTTAITGLSYTYSDATLLTGLNVYRVRILLQDGRVIYSQPETVYYLGSMNYIVYPNPANQNEPVRILSRDAQITKIQVYNSIGAKVYETVFTDLLNTIPAGRLSKGFYILRLIGENDTRESVKLIIQ
ncbi:MAG: S8 family peptidase [Chitinophagaceae bacterium]